MNFADTLSLLAARVSSSGGDGAPFVLIGFFLLLGIASLVVWIWSLIHCIRNRMLSDTNRLIGIILILVLHLVGSLIYLFLPREPTPQR